MLLRWPIMLMAMLMTAGCGVFADAKRQPPPAPAVASASQQQQHAAQVEQIASVEVSWEDKSTLRAPATEANMLSTAILQELRQRNMSHVQADRTLRVRVMEVLVAAGGQMKTGTSVLNARVYVLAADGSQLLNYPLRTALTVTARSSQTPEQQLSALYKRFAEQTADALQQQQ